MTNTPINPVMEMKIGGVWVDITDDVRLDSADSGGNVRIERGVPNEGGSAEPTQLDFVLNNKGGKYSPKNPYSVNFGKLGRNTPVRFAVSRRIDDFNRTETDTWGRLSSWVDREKKTQTGERWTLQGSGLRFSMTPGAAQIAGASGVLMASFGNYGDVEVKTKVKVSNLTTEFGVLLRGKDPNIGYDSGDFENGLGTWAVNAGTSALTVQSGTVHSGSLAAQLVVAGAPVTVDARPAVVPVVAGQAYRSRWWLRCTTTRNAYLTITWYNASMVQIAQATGLPALTANVWATSTLTAIAPDDAVFAAYGAGFDLSPGPGTTLFIDDVSFQKNSTFEWLTAYVTPGTPDLIQLGITSPEFITANSVVSPIANVVINTSYWIVAQISGIRRRVKIWKDGDPEPTAWALTVHSQNAAWGDISTIPNGQVGLYTNNGSANVVYQSFEVNVWRAYAEIAELPPRWDLSRQDRWTPIAARGVLRRLGQGRKSLDSPVTLHLNAYTALSRYWLPLEVIDETTSTVSNRIPGAQNGTAFSITQGDPPTTGTFAAPGIGGAAVLSAADSYISIGTTPGATNGPWTAMTFLRIPGSVASDSLIFQFETTGTARKIQLWYLSVGNNLRCDFLDGDGALITSATGAFYFLPQHPVGSWLAGALYLFASGGTVNWAFNYHKPGGSIFYTVNGTYSGIPGTLQHAKAISSAALVTAGCLQVAHMFHYQGDLPFVTAAFARAAYAYITEEAITRFLRLATNNGVLATSPGVSSEQMGAQSQSELLDLWDECAIVDDSIIMEERESPAVSIRARNTMYQQKPILLHIDQGHLSAPLEPTADDQRTRNDVTVTRTGGGFYRSVALDGPMNINPPETDPTNGVGVYSENTEMNYATDAQCQPAANWRRSKGTLDAVRYPAITADLTASVYQASLGKTAEVYSLDSGDMITVFNTEVDYAPVDQMIQGYSENIGQYEWDITFTANPGAVWEVGSLDKNTRLATRYLFVDTPGFVAGTDTRLWSLRTGIGALWVQVADSPQSFPFEIEILGCRLMVEATGNVLNSNPYFETGLAGWALHSSTTIYWDRKLGNYKSGIGAIRCTAVGATTGGAIGTVPITVVPAATYQISGWVMTNVNLATVSLVVDWYLADGVTFVSTSFPTTIATIASTWVHFAAVVTCPPTGVRAYPRIRAVMADTNTIWADDVRLMPTDSFVGPNSQLLSIRQAPTNGVIKTLPATSAIAVVDPWRLAF